MKDLLKRERNWLTLFALFLAAIVLPRVVALSREELFIILVAVIILINGRQISRQIEQVSKQMEQISKQIEDGVESIGNRLERIGERLGLKENHNPSLEPAKKPEPTRQPPPETTGKGAAGFGLIGAGIGFLGGGVPGLILGAIIGAAIGDQIERNERRRPRQ